MSLKQRIPLLRWSVWRMATGAHNITTTGQIGDGREAAAVEYVLKHARAGDIDAIWCWNRSIWAPNRRGRGAQCARGWASAQTSRSVCTVTIV
jgi:hypothetical protein